VNRSAVIYSRYSTDLQSPRAIEDQIALCRRYAERHGWMVVGTYSDAALSGFATENRPDYQRLLGDALEGARRFDVILVEDLSRLTRDTSELLRLHRRLVLRGIEIVGVADGIATSAKGAKVHLTVKGLVNELYLDDLREKVHRGLAGCATRGLSAGGKTFGYKSVPVEGAGRPGKDSQSARLVIHPAEADIVRRIFVEYSQGRSLRSITDRLNVERVPFPTKDTQRGPIRRGWAMASVRFILRNGRYGGILTWNKKQFLKDPDTGRRRAVLRPDSEWITREHPELRIIEPELWEAVCQRRRLLEERYQGCNRGRLPGARTLKSPYLLSGLLRCGSCGARMVGHTLTRKKAGRVYRSGWYRCSFNWTKGPGVCRHEAAYHQDVLDGELITRFRAAMSGEHIEALCAALNRYVMEAFEQDRPRAEKVAEELQRARREAANLVSFLKKGDESAIVRAELHAVEARIATLENDLALANSRALIPPEVHPEWIRARLERLLELLQADPEAAKAELVKHLDGDLKITPRPAPLNERRALISGAVRPDGLLGESPGGHLRIRVLRGLDSNSDGDEQPPLPHPGRAEGGRLNGLQLPEGQSPSR
jgi:DNA invertase Pin-like site-specific DNA recombinase